MSLSHVQDYKAFARSVVCFLHGKQIEPCTREALHLQPRAADRSQRGSW